MIKFIKRGFHNQPIPILYVDDNPNDILLAAEATRAYDSKLQITGLGCIQRSLDYLTGKGEFADRRSLPLPALVLLDYSIGNQTGTELLRWMRLHPHFQLTPVVMYTDSDDNARVQASYAAGASGFLQKATCLTRLIAILHTLENCLASAPADMAALRRLAEYRPLTAQPAKK